MSVLYLPKTCGKFVDFKFRVEPEFQYSIKDESIGHVALLAI